MWRESDNLWIWLWQQNLEFNQGARRFFPKIKEFQGLFKDYDWNLKQLLWEAVAKTQLKVFDEDYRVSTAIFHVPVNETVPIWIYVM